MANHLVYYKEEIDTLTKRVDNCSTDTLDSIEFFFKEANAHMTGVSDDVAKKIRSEIKRFKKDCKCKTSAMKKFEDMSAEEFISSGYKR